MKASTAELIPRLPSYRSISVWTTFQYPVPLTVEQATEMLTPHESVQYQENTNGDLIIIGRNLTIKRKPSLKERVYKAIEVAHPAPLPHFQLIKTTWRYGNAQAVLECLQELATENKIIQSIIRNGHKEAMIYNLSTAVARPPLPTEHIQSI